MQAKEKPKIDVLEQLEGHNYNREEDVHENDNVLGI